MNTETVTVWPLTSKNRRKIYPFEVYLGKGTGNLPKNSKIKADRVRTLDISRLIKLIGGLGMSEIEAIWVLGQGIVPA